MNSHNQTLLLAANTILSELLQTGVQGVVCGGFARDVQYHHNAKDIDIAVGCAGMSISDLAGVVEHLETLPFNTRVYWTGEKAPICDSPDMEAKRVGILDPRDPDREASEPTEKDHKVLLVVQFPQLHVDIIFYDVLHDASELVAQHDCNVNQFVMAGSTPVFLGLFHPDKHGLRIMKEGLHPDRIAYMERKWEAIAPPVDFPETYEIPFAE